MTATPHRKPRTVDEYLADVPASARGQFGVLRETIAKAAPGAQEGLSHNILAFRHGGLLVACATFTRHVGFYPRASALTAFRSELAGGKGHRPISARTGRCRWISLLEWCGSDWPKISRGRITVRNRE